MAKGMKKRPRGGQKSEAPRNVTQHKVREPDAGKALAEGLDGIKADLQGLEEKIPDVGPLREEIDGLKADLQELADREIPEAADHSQELAGYKKRIEALENAANAPSQAKGKTMKTIGQDVFDADGFKAFREEKTQNYKHAIPSISGRGGGVKETILGSAELSALAYDFNRQAIVSDPEESVAAYIDLIPRVAMPGAETFRYRKETSKSITGYVHTTLAADLDGDPTPKTTIEFTSVDGFVEGTYVRFWPTAGMQRKKIVSINTTTKVVTFATDDLDFDALTGDDVTSEQFGATAESGTKPYGFLEFEQQTVNLKTLAELMGVTQQRLNAAPTLDALIRRKLPERMRRSLSWHLLYGDATVANQLAGFASDTNVQTYLWSSGSVGDNRVDAMLKAALLVVGDNVTFVMNKRDLLTLRLLKSATDGHYLMAGDFGRVPFEMVGGQWQIDGHPIVVSDAVIDGDFFAIDFARASELLDQQTSALAFGWVNAQFAENEVTVRYEETLAHAILSTAAYVYGTWDSAPT